MAKTTTIIFLLAGILAFNAQAIAQQQDKPSEHDQHDHSGHNMDHDAHDDHSGHSMNQDKHDHSGHSISKGTGHAAEHGADDTDHGHEHDIDHSAHDTDTQATEHGDLHHHHHMDHDDHIMDHEGTMIMGQNLDKLPSSCQSISEEIEITVRAGRKYAAKFPGTAFAFDQQQWHVKPCAKVTWHFINEDSVRHQFMMHGLPKYLYKYGMFHLEVTGPKTVSGTIIVPGADETYLVHCDISHHMEKGMKAQLVVGKGGEDIPSIPGLTAYTINDIYEAEDLPKVSDKAEQNAIVKQITEFTNDNFQTYGTMLIGTLIGLLLIPLFKRIPLRKKSD
ncbi:cupredoxin domain-containing protein [uncultured Nitrosomonas sp.]|uniref:cupredoxin domain-containing protein n=1 Tax=uncultured Nitrosomonas sp. TaxID=156424 RepID=UPI0025F34A02|nr:cupredoxin domain-containing protein [uncultured Nitrosomonas sp.]